MVAMGAAWFSSVLLFSFLRACEGSAFLRKYDVVFMASEGMNEAEVEKNLLEEIKGYMRQGVQDEHLRDTQKVFEPIWPALPKNEFGNVDGATARYALHRFFVQRHGWHIRGLESDVVSTTGAASADNSSSSSAGNVMKEKVPGFLIELFKKALSGRGFRLDSLVVLASTIERLIHDEAVDRLHEAYIGLGLSTTSRATYDDAQEAMEAYTASLVGGSSLPALSKLKPSQVRRLLVKFGKRYPAWADTQMWLRDVKNTQTYLAQDKTNGFKFEPGYSPAEVQSMADAVSENFGSWQDLECRHLKDTLLEVEEGETGRVKLSDFYKKNLESANSWYFAEPVEHLREQGALEEKSGFGEPRVIVANYLTSRGNCVGDSGFYSICCINECDRLMAKLEHEVVGPRAPASQIASLVANLSSDTVDAPRTLSEPLLQRLDEVAKSNGGEVVLHSRLFSQWMHFAFPRECPKVSFAPKIDQLQQGPATAAKTEESIRRYLETTADVIDENAAPFHELESLYLPEELPVSGGLTTLRTVGKIAAVGAVGLVATTQAAKHLGMVDGKVASQLGLQEKAHFV